VGRWRVGLRVGFPAKPQVSVASLSGGQLATVGLCLALAFFLEVPSPALVLDEVEPALDEAMVRRLGSLLRAVSLERQVIVVSHQRRIRDTADAVFDLRRSADEGSRVWFRYDPRCLRAPGGGSRA
jgi:chromosome segregation ATPase